ncbi:MAG: GPR endopeptidase [Ruminococcaceae bacterium]|nr:GPR endopeptidase [Oscillospiraceae bacterium]
MNCYVRSDLACETCKEPDRLPKGATLRTEQVGTVKIDRLSVVTEAAASALGRPCGEYVTFHSAPFFRLSKDAELCLTRLLAGEVKGLSARLAGKEVTSRFSVLAVGLGNESLTADAIGPQTVKRLTATRHLRNEEQELYRTLECASISILAPGVLGQTGIETAELLRVAVELVKPDVLVVVDALAASQRERLAATVQISDTGISPGSGVGNHRAAINRESMGVPVISIGIPTVMHSGSLALDALFRAGLKEEDRLLQEVLAAEDGFFVSLKESDLVTKAASRILSRALCYAFSEALHELCE